jgi:hypothetical protein
MRKKRTDQKGAPGICVNENTTFEEKNRQRGPEGPGVAGWVGGGGIARLRSRG